MARINEPGLVYFYQGEPVANGLMYYFESGTSTLKETYADSGENVPNSNPVVMNADGSEPNVFYSGSAKKVLTTSLGEQVFEADPVGGNNQLGNFSDFNLEIIYGQSDIVRFNDKFYLSLKTDNQGNSPDVDDGTNWTEIDFVNPSWSTGDTYRPGELVTGSNGQLYQSKVEPNKGNDPTGDATETNWKRIFYSSGAISPTSQLELNRPNVLSTATTFKLPDTSTVNVGDSVYCWLPDEFKANQPTVIVSDTGTETITVQSGTDTDVLLDLGRSISIAFEFTGSANWRLVL